MPPKRKRGGSASRGRRGRPPKKNLPVAQTETIALPALDINETSSSNSPILEEQSHAGTKIKLETKIHKKFGIKYHVPDEVVAPKHISPNEDAATNPRVFMPEASEESSSPKDELCGEEKMETDSTSVAENLVENEISEQFNHLEVIEEGSEVADNVEELDEVNLEGGVVLEYITTDEHVSQNEDEVLLSGENEIVGMHDDSTEEVYYVVEETDDTEIVMEGEAEVLEPKVEPDDSEEICDAKNDVGEHETELNQNQQDVMKIEESDLQGDIKMEGCDEVKDRNDMHEVITKPKDKLKIKEEKVKILEKPSRKSTRISLRGVRKSVVEASTSVSLTHPADVEIPTVEPIQEPIKEEEQNEIITIESTSINELDQEIIKPMQEENKLSESPVEVKNENEESLNESMELMNIAAKESSKKVKKVKKMIKPKSPGKETKPISPTKECKLSSPGKESKALLKEPRIKKESNESKDKDEKLKKSNKKPAGTIKPKVKKMKESKSQKIDDEDSSIRRSSRIKTISTQKVRSKGKGLVKKDDNNDHTSSSQSSEDKSVFIAPVNASDNEHKPVKVKSRWRRSSELEMRDIVKSPGSDNPISDKEIEKKKNDNCEVEKRLKQFAHLKENVYLTERISCKEAKKMVCDCFLTDEEVQEGEYGCGDDCLNRLLMIECGNLCAVGERCTNKRFQKLQSAPVEAFCTDKKGLGIRAIVNIPSGEFILEYVGEVLDAEKFEQRAAEYSKDKNTHYYFMSLRADAIIDATMKGNISRFINHSCEPNAETQKWTVNGELRIGFFSKKTILAGEEITFDYQFQRYGKEAQKCFCEAPTCRGWLGEEPDSEDESEEEDDDDEEEEVVEETAVPKEDGPEPEKGEENNVDVNQTEGKETIEPIVVVPVVSTVIKKEKAPKKERKPRILKQRFKTRIDRFEDLGLDEEIESLQATGLKNQAHTLKFSRLMLRAKEPVQRTKLLKLLKKGEFPCRRLFLDYHGLKLIHGWMMDAQHLARNDPSMENLRLDILQTLAVLPIPSKTMLQDSKVLTTVVKWSSKEAQQSPVDSDSNSPKLDTESAASCLSKEETNLAKEKEEPQTAVIPRSSPDNGKKPDKKTSKPTSDLSTTKTSSGSPEVLQPPPANPENVILDEPDDDGLRKSTGMNPKYVKLIPSYNVGSIKEELLLMFADDFVPLPMPTIKVIKPKPIKPKYDILVEIIELALKLLEEWSTLKEMFRIPKKERIEQMKEHEREADRRYKALSVEQETERKRDRYRNFQRPSRNEVNDRSKERVKTDRYSSNTKLSKYERRELFARQAEEEERRRKQQLWAQQKPPSWIMTPDPRLQTTFDPNSNMQYVWNPQIGQWQNVADTNVPPPSHNMSNIPRGIPNPPPGPHGISTMPPGMRPNMPPFSFPPPHGIQPLQPGMLPPNVVQPNMPPANMGAVLPMPNIPPRPAIPYQGEEEDPSKVRFLGPIPPPAKLPPKWKCAKDKYGRPYYYHVKIRKAQWEPPPCPEEEQEADEESETSSSSDTSSLSSSSDSEDSDSEDDTKLMLEIRKKFEQQKVAKAKKQEEEKHHLAEVALPALTNSFLLSDDTTISDISMMTDMMDKTMAEECSPPEAQIAECSPLKKRRVGLVQELIISPRSEEDRLQFREDAKKYKLNKEMVRKQKELLNAQHKKLSKSSLSTSADIKTNPKIHKKKISTKVKIREMEANTNIEESKKIKETFRAAMATVMVSILNPFRKPDCKEGRINGTEDFKHLARKLTHFVMLKELKHCDKIEELECTESVKSKAKEFVRKYMAKFGEVYQRPPEEVDNF